jgi:hypothetical protein
MPRTQKVTRRVGSRFGVSTLTLLLLLPLAASAQPRSTSTPPPTSPPTRSSGSGTASSSTGTTTSSPSVTCPLKAGAPENATKTKSGLLCLEDVPGQWFPLDAARLLLRDLAAGKEALALQPKLEARIDLAASTEKLLKDQLANEEKITATWEKVARVQTERLQQREAWYKSPTLWFAVGFVTATAVGFGIAKLYSETR